MWNVMGRELLYICYFAGIQFQQIFPYWILGVLIGSLVAVFLRAPIHNVMDSIEDKRMGLWGIVPASMLGILSPMCMYGTVPIVASFARRGMREDWIAAFMMSSILLNPQLLFYSLALGGSMAALRLTACFLGGCIAGILVHVCFRKKPFFTFSSFDLPESHDTDPSLMLRVLKNIWRNVKITFPYFLLGVILTALYQRYIPSHWTADLFGTNQGFGTLMAAALGIPLYTCGGGTIPLLLAWLDNGMSRGSAVSFMLAGPATKLTNLSAVKIVLGQRNFILYLLFSIFLSVFLGLVTELFF